MMMTNTATLGRVEEGNRKMPLIAMKRMRTLCKVEPLSHHQRPAGVRLKPNSVLHHARAENNGAASTHWWMLIIFK